jgi:hypothetical protein
MIKALHLSNKKGNACEILASAAWANTTLIQKRTQESVVPTKESATWSLVRKSRAVETNTY